MPWVRKGLKRPFDGSQLSCCILGCHGYGVTVRKRGAKRVREDDFLFHQADGCARCSRNQVGSAFPWQPEIWKGEEKKNDFMLSRSFSLCSAGILCSVKWRSAQLYKFGCA